MHRVFAAALLVVLAGCGAAVSDTARTETATATPVPVPTDPTPEPDLYPPGVTADEVDADTLATATARSLNDTAFAFRLDRREARPEPSLGTVYVGPRLRVDAASHSRYLLNRTVVTERGGGLAIETFRNATFVCGERATKRTGDTVSVSPRASDDQTHPTARAAAIVRRHLAVENVTISRPANETAVVRGSGTSLANVSQYSITAVVAADGAVTQFDAVFVRDERVRFVRFRLDRDATFERPDWAGETDCRTGNEPDG